MYADGLSARSSHHFKVPGGGTINSVSKKEMTLQSASKSGLSAIAEPTQDYNFRDELQQSLEVNKLDQIS